MTPQQAALFKEFQAHFGHADFVRACANPERLDSSRRGMGCSLSLRERVRVRGNETPPTKTAGRILRAQLDRRKQAGALVFRALLPPHPGPLPQGEGESPTALALIQSGWIGRGAGCGVPRGG